MIAILANIGFVMQISGIFMLIPIFLSLLSQEINAALGLFITAIAFFSFGFILNGLCERKELNYKQSSSLFFLAFLFLGIIGSIPYFYIELFQGTLFEKITNSIFESVSGYTTTGFTMIENIEKVPTSIILYRAMTQFIGGIGIVLLLLAFFYPDEKLKKFSKTMGFPENGRIKRNFFMVLLIYFLYSVFIIIFSLLTGYKDILNLVSLTFTIISTGGFSPVNDLSSIVSTPVIYPFMLGMILGASNFIVLAGLVKFKFKEFFKSEVSVYLLMIIFWISVTILFFRMKVMDAAFHIISAMTNTGLSYLNLSTMESNFKFILTVLMFIGGTSLSTAGGIKIFRLLLVFKSIRKGIIDTITDSNVKISLFGKEYSNGNVIQALSVIFLMFICLLIASFIVISQGYHSIDSFFEVASAISNTGLSVGIISVSSSLLIKWVFIIVMLLGRVEVIAFIIMLSFFNDKKTEILNHGKTEVKNLIDSLSHKIIPK